MDAIANLVVTKFGSVVTVVNPRFEERRITNLRLHGGGRISAHQFLHN